MGSFIQSRIQSIRYALNGINYVLRTQRNAWIHALASTVVFVLAFILQLPARDWAILILTIGFVWAAELINTALESIVDLISPQNHPLAKIGKDVSAAAVLVAAACSIFIGLFLLGPPLWFRIRDLFTHW